MNLANYRIRISPRSKSQNSEIRSGRFAKKNYYGIPRKNKESVSLHYPLSFHLRNDFYEKRNASPLEVSFYTHNRSCSLPSVTESSVSPSKKSQTKSPDRVYTVLKRYLRRKYRSPFFRKDNFSKNKHQTVSTSETMGPETENFQSFAFLEKKVFTFEEPKTQNKYDVFFITAEEVGLINKKSLHQMNSRELSLNLDWKYQFFDIYQRKTKNK